MLQEKERESGNSIFCIKCKTQRCFNTYICGASVTVVFYEALSLITLLYKLYLCVTAGNNIPDCSYENDAIVCSCAVL